METVLITGVSSGIGLGLAKGFIKSDYQVIGSVRTTAKALELQEMLGERFFPLVFDITNHWEIDIAVNSIKNILSGSHLCGLVNNAGIAEIGPLLHVSMADVRKQFETLVFGQLRIIQSFFRFLLPVNSRLPPGRIINISSVSGNSSNFFFGCYAAGKHALEGISKTLREELKMYGVKVIVVAPGNISTSLWEKQTTTIAQKYKDTIYYPSLQKRLDHINSVVIKEAMSIDEFTKQFLEIFSEHEPAERYTIYNKRSLFFNRIVTIRG